MKTTRPLTEKQQECKEYMQAFVKTHNKLPRVEDVANALRIPRTTAHRCMIRVKKNGFEIHASSMSIMEYRAHLLCSFLRWQERLPKDHYIFTRSHEDMVNAFLNDHLLLG
jgi:hypothetical protein